MGCLLLRDDTGWHIRYDTPADRTAENLLHHVRYRIRQLLRYRTDLNHMPSGWCDTIASAARSGGSTHNARELCLLVELLRGRPVSVWSPEDRRWLNYMHVVLERLDKRKLADEDIPTLERILLSVVGEE